MYWRMIHPLKKKLSLLPTTNQITLYQPYVMDKNSSSFPTRAFYAESIYEWSDNKRKITDALKDCKKKKKPRTAEKITEEHGRARKKKKHNRGQTSKKKTGEPRGKTSSQVMIMRRTKKVRNQTKVQRARKQSKGGKAVLVVHSFSCGVRSQLEDVNLWLLFLYFPQRRRNPMRRRHNRRRRRRRHAETWTGHELTVTRTVPITETSLAEV